MISRKYRFIIGKLGLDSHDNGCRIISRWLMEGGYEVIYAGLYNTTDRIVDMALQEDADAIGISFLGGEHLFYSAELVEALEKHRMKHVKVIVGGVIPPSDVDVLMEKGVDAVFTPGTRKGMIMKSIQGILTEKS